MVDTKLAALRNFRRTRRPALVLSAFASMHSERRLGGCVSDMRVKRQINILLCDDQEYLLLASR